MYMISQAKFHRHSKGLETNRKLTRARKLRFSGVLTKGNPSTQIEYPPNWVTLAREMCECKSNPLSL